MNKVNLYSVSILYGNDIAHCECMGVNSQKDFLPDVYKKFDIKPADRSKVKITKIEFLKELGL